MTSHDRRKRPPGRAWAAAPSEEDGADPRVFFDRRQRTRDDRKGRQLAAQAAEALAHALAADPDDAVRDLLVAAVAPGGGGLLVVTVALPRGGDRAAAERAEAALQSAHGRLRAAVAAAVTRRRAPDLRFVVALTTDGEGTA